MAVSGEPGKAVMRSPACIRASGSRPDGVASRVMRHVADQRSETWPVLSTLNGDGQPRWLALARNTLLSTAGPVATNHRKSRTKRFTLN